jgi:hypothetical protein
MLRKTWGIVSLLGLIIVGAAQTAKAQAACDRACLKQMLDQYLAAVVKHDPSAAPLVVGFRQTENAINTRPGNGIWKTATALGKVQRRYLEGAETIPGPRIRTGGFFWHDRGGRQHGDRECSSAR